VNARMDIIEGHTINLLNRSEVTKKKDIP